MGWALLFKRFLFTYMAIGMSACAMLPAAEEPATLPPGVYGVYLDNDTGAIDYAAWAFSSADNLRGNPVAAAKALIALEYLPAALRYNPRWIKIDPAVALHLEHARLRYRQVLAIPPAVSNQMVVDALLTVAENLQRRHQDATLQAFQAPPFTLSPAKTFAALSNVPYNEEANLATARALAQSNASDGSRG